VEENKRRGKREKKKKKRFDTTGLAQREARLFFFFSWQGREKGKGRSTSGFGVTQQKKPPQFLKGACPPCRTFFPPQGKGKKKKKKKKNSTLRHHAVHYSAA